MNDNEKEKIKSFEELKEEIEKKKIEIDDIKYSLIQAEKTIDLITAYYKIAKIIEETEKRISKI